MRDRYNIITTFATPLPYKEHRDNVPALPLESASSLILPSSQELFLLLPHLAQTSQETPGSDCCVHRTGKCPGVWESKCAQNREPQCGLLAAGASSA